MKKPPLIFEGFGLAEGALLILCFILLTILACFLLGEDD